jgi:pimeloyl-ACP methyl ester carboxylesterase
LKQEIRFCTTPDAVRIAYATVGDGPPLVKAANYLTHLEHDWQGPVWRHWLEGLAQHHTLIRYDERGCGLSEVITPKTVRNYVSRIYSKLSIQSRAQAIVLARESGLGQGTTLQ